MEKIYKMVVGRFLWELDVKIVTVYVIVLCKIIQICLGYALANPVAVAYRNM